MKKTFSLLLVLALTLNLTACIYYDNTDRDNDDDNDSNKKIDMSIAVIGEWYNEEEDDYLILRSDNTYKMKHHSGAAGYEIGSDYGTWEWLEVEEFIKFKDANGYTHEETVTITDGIMQIEYYYYGEFEKEYKVKNNDNSSSLFGSDDKKTDIETAVIGEWYNEEEDDYLILRSDNTYKMKHHSGAAGYEIGSDYGTWEWLEVEEFIKFKDANGYTHEETVTITDGTMYIDYYYYGTFKK